MMIFTPISTSLGILLGRDAIYLDRLEQTKKTLVLEGEINGSLCQVTSKKRRWIKFSLTFRGVEAYDVETVDTSAVDCESSFDLVEGSERLKTIRTTVPSTSEYLIATYDFVIRVIAREYTFKLGTERSD